MTSVLPSFKYSKTAFENGLVTGKLALALALALNHQVPHPHSKLFPHQFHTINQPTLFCTALPWPLSSSLPAKSAPPSPNPSTARSSTSTPPPSKSPSPSLPAIANNFKVSSSYSVSTRPPTLARKSTPRTRHARCGLGGVAWKSMPGRFSP